MEEILAIVLIFGGGTAIALSFSPVGKALAARIRGGGGDGAEPHPEILEELDQLRHDLVEVQERLDFTERLLAGQRQDAGVLPGSGGSP